jgi:hypothetical protein
MKVSYIDLIQFPVYGIKSGIFNTDLPYITITVNVAIT